MLAESVTESVRTKKPSPPTSWARPERLRCARVVGDSMAPAIRDGDLVVLDAGRAEPLDGQVFVVRMGEGVLVKRLRRTDDRWELESDNPAYEPRAVTDQDRILGQVAWAGHHPLDTRPSPNERAGSGRQHWDRSGLAP